MSRNHTLANLRDVLAKLYPSYESYHRVIVSAGLSSEYIPSRGKPVGVWHAILIEAQRQGKIQTIVTVAFSEHPENERLAHIAELVRSGAWLSIQDKWARVKEALQQLGLSERKIWQIERTRDYLADVSSLGEPLLPDFTLYDLTHSDNIVHLLAGLQDEFEFKLSGYEAYLLGTSAYLHNLGMFFDRERFRQKILPDPKGTLRTCPENRCDRIENYRIEGREIGEQIRETHNLLSALMLQESPGISRDVGLDSVPYLMAICRGYRKADLREHNCMCYRNEPLEGGVIRVGLLTALLRLADALDSCRNRAPQEVFHYRALSFLKNPTALEHWFRHYFVTDPYVTRQDQGRKIALVYTANFRVPMKRINGESYLDFFQPLFANHVAELNRRELDINQYPPVFGAVLNITTMRAILKTGERPGFRDLPEEIIDQIRESGGKNILDFLRWLQLGIGRLPTMSRPSEKSSKAASSNPFCLRATVQPEHFYGRDSEVRHALRRLRYLENIEVIGPRRIGKTWFLQYLSHPTTLRKNLIDPRRNIFVYIDCQHRFLRQEQPLVYERMLERIVDAANRAGVDLGPGLQDRSGGGATFERLLMEMSRRGLRTILLLDEFEEMVQNPNLDAGFFSHLRALWSSDDVAVAYVTASCIDMVNLFSKHRFPGSPLFDGFRPIPLGLFSERDSRHIVEDSLRRAGTGIPGELLALVLEVGGGHPFFLQMAGSYAFDLEFMGEEFTEGKRQSFLEAVNMEAAGHFEYSWKRLSEQEQYVLAALPLLWQDRSYEKTIERLRSQCLITQRDGRYNYFSTLFERFVRRQKVSSLLQAGPLMIDQRRKEVLLRGELLHLSVTSYSLLTYLVERAGQVVSNEELWQAAWPEASQSDDQRPRSAIRTLRNALGKDADYVVGTREEGYIFQLAEQAHGQIESQLERVPTHTWHLVFEGVPTDNLMVGQSFTLFLRLTSEEQPGSKPLRIPASALELTVYVEAPGFHIDSNHLRTLHVIDGRPVEYILPLKLIPLTSGQQEVHLSVYPGQRIEGLKPAEMTQIVRVTPPMALPDIPELIDRRAIPDPQPNVMLYVALEDTPDGQQVRLNLTCPTLGLDREPLDPLPLTEQDLAGLRQAAFQAAAEVASNASPDALTSLRAFGRGLFDLLMPPGHPLREWYWHVFALAARGDTPWSWLIVSDERAVLPWELVCPYMPRPDRTEVWHDEFLGRKFVLAHWVGRQGLTLAGEAPLGLLDLTHYQQHPQEIPRWQAILGGADQVGVEDETRHLALMQADSRYYGLHILRYSDRHQLGRITALDEQEAKPDTDRSEAETIIVDRRLDFTLRRPVVGLSFVDEQPVSVDMGLRGRDTRLEAGWMLPLMHAGATALVGARWLVSPESDQLFYSVFYQTIRNGIPLGWAVWEAREQVRLVFPHRPDWLAYAYFGHPWCQPYRVRPAQGFTLFEAIKHSKGEPFLAGETYQFRASYRAEPPAWYDGPLKYRQVPRREEDVSVLVMPLTGVMPETHQLEPIFAGDGYQCQVMLTMPDTETTWPVLVRFQKGEQELRTLVLNFDVVEKV